MLDCDIDVPARICGRFLVSLRNTNAVDFGADYSTIGNIEVLQPGWRRVAGISAVRIEVEGGEILPAQKLDVHRQERSVINRVDVAQLVIEFQAVKYRQFLRCTEDIVRQQISVAVNDVMVGEALCEQRTTTRNELGGKTLYLANGRMRDHGVWIALQLLEVLLPASSDRTDRCLSFDRPPASRVGVKPCQSLGNRSQLIVNGFTVRDHRSQTSVVGVPTHDDNWFGHAAVRSGEVRHPQVTLRGEPAVQRNFAFARILATLERAEVEEIIGDGLLCLVCLVTEKNNQSRVRLAALVRRGSP